TGATTASFAAAQTFSVGSGTVGVAAADLNGDGKQDLVVANLQNGNVSVLLNTTTPGSTTASFTSQTTFAVGASPEELAVGDVNGDGLTDVVVTNNSGKTVSVLLNTTTPGSTIPTFAAQQTLQTITKPIGIVLADINNDGKPDILANDAGAV